MRIAGGVPAGWLCPVVAAFLPKAPMPPETVHEPSGDRVLSEESSLAQALPWPTFAGGSLFSFLDMGRPDF